MPTPGTGLESGGGKLGPPLGILPGFAISVIFGTNWTGWSGKPVPPPSWVTMAKMH